MPVENIKSPRIVEIFNSDGTIVTYPSITSVVNSWKLSSGNTAAVYRHVARGGGRLIDNRIPVEVIKEDGTRITFQDINAVARH